MNEFPHVAALVFNRPWAILPETLHVICELIRRRIGGDRLTDDEIELRIGAAKARVQPAKGKVTVLPLHGVLGYRMNQFEDVSGGTSTERFGRWFSEAVQDSSVGAIVMDIDSPGGTVDGLPELADQIFKARESKPIYAVANAMAASAGYYIGAAASQLWVTPSGTVGSIGTFAEHYDYSKALENAGVKPTVITSAVSPFKGEGNPDLPLPDDALAELQRVVDAYGEQFVSDVAKFRGVQASVVRRDFGQGRMAMADEAVSKGMADRVGTLDELMAKLGATRSTDSLRKRAELRERKLAAGA